MTQEHGCLPCYHFSSLLPHGWNLSKCLTALLRCNGRTHRSLVVNDLSSLSPSAFKPSCKMTVVSQLGAPLRSHLRLLSIHPSQHGISFSHPQDFSVEYPAGYSLRHRFFHYPDLFWSDKKVSTGAAKCQPVSDSILFIADRCCIPL